MYAIRIITTSENLVLSEAISRCQVPPFTCVTARFPYIERQSAQVGLAERLSRSARNVLVLHGGLGQKARRELADRLETIADAQERVLIATDRYVGEGFDDARLDTLFLTMPISWRGTLTQYAGRLHRIHPNKREVIVYDYVDGEVPVLARMSLKRITGFKSLGYSVAAP